MKRLSGYHLIAILLLGILLSCTEEIEINNATDFDLFIAEEMDYQSIPAAAVLIFKGETILYEKYFGKSNVEQNIPLADNHLFLIASISKVVTATALLQLYDDGKFELDDPINDHLPFDVVLPNYNTPITFRMLLTHTSGIADNYDVLDRQYYDNQDSPISLSYFIENYFSEDGAFYDTNENFYDFEPGAAHEYSNIGNALIGVLVENISEQDFNSYCKQHIFNPLGMQNSFWRLDEIDKNIVIPYDDVNGQNRSIAHYTFTDFPNGGLRTTTKDLHFLASAFVNGGQTGDVQLLKKSTAEAMFTPQITAIDNEVGLHLFVMDNQNNLWGHDGGEKGVSTILGFNPTSKIGAIILTNQGEAELDEVLVEAYKFGLKL
ncbi:MAG: serine hydrolase domain-containing protein [Cyclobacteriaceae bacterium]